jgi:chlorite dismutase
MVGKEMKMSIDELETIASNLYRLVRDAHEFGQSRDTILTIVAEFADEIQDQADDLAIAMAKYHRENA